MRFMESRASDDDAILFEGWSMFFAVEAGH